MRTKLFTTEIEDAKLVYQERGLLTDIDIAAYEGQHIELDGVAYEIHQIKFKMVSSGSAIDAEKQIILQEVLPEE